MNNLTTLVIAILFSTVAIGQEIYVDMGTSTNNFRVTNSNGDVVDGFNAKTYDQLNIGYRHMYNETITITAGLGYTGFGAYGHTPFNNVEYDLRYVQLKVGGEYLAYVYEDLINVSAVAQLGVGAMVVGTQSLDGIFYSLTDLPEDENHYGNVLMSINAGVRASMALSDAAELYLNLLGGYYSPLPFSAEGEESLEIYGGSVSVGLVVDLNLD
jgi:hypothetical protein